MNYLNDFKNFLKTLSEEEIKGLSNKINSTLTKKEDITNVCLSSFVFSYKHLTGKLEYVDDVLVLKCNNDIHIENPVLDKLIVEKFKK